MQELRLRLLLQFLYLFARAENQQTDSTTLERERGSIPVPRNLQSNAGIRHCAQRLGMGDGRIPTSRISVSSELQPTSQWGKRNARLDNQESDVAWGAPANDYQWLQVDFGKVVLVSGIITKGVTIYHGQWSGFYWVSEFEVLYKMRDTDPVFTAITNGQWGRKKIFHGNENGSNEVKNMFYTAIQMQIIRIVPVHWPVTRRTLAMKVEFLGCTVENSLTSGCGSIRVLRNPTGFLSSMNYPENYENNANCEWKIVAWKGQVVMLNFENEIAIEEGSDCMMEYVKVTDVIRTEEKTLAKLCGNQQPGQFSSTEEVLEVKFMTDHYVTDKGFRANYHFVNGSGCGGPQVLMEQTGSFYFHSWRANNENSCSWDIYVADDMLIEIDFIYNRPAAQPVGQRRFSNDDLIQLYEDSRETQHLSFCENVYEKTYTSMGYYLSVHISNTHVHNTEITAQYRGVVASGCGGRRDLKGPSGTFTTLFHPKPYGVNERCEWNITSNENQSIELTFEVFDLEGDRECRYDYVSIFAGSNPRDFVGKYCGSRTFADPFISSSGMMKVIFVSDKVNVNKGFNATYVIKDIDHDIKPTHESIQPKKTTVFNDIATTSETDTKRVKTTIAANQTTEILGPTTRTRIILRTSVSINANASSSRSVPGERRTVLKKSTIVNSTTVTKEMVKWIIVALASLSGLLIVFVLLGIILCCRQNIACAIGKQSFRHTNNNSSIIQNNAYDFSIGSTNQSMRSRKIEPPDSSQMSESFSRQDTLRRSRSGDSHIYFSIEECAKINQKDKNHTNETNKRVEIEDVKVHFKAEKFESGNDVSSSNDISSQYVESLSNDDAEDKTDNEDMNWSIDSNPDVAHTSRRTSKYDRKDSTDVTQDAGMTEYNNVADKKKVVDNILYISTDVV